MDNEIVVGFVGLGTMGGKTATNILKAGYKVEVHDLRRQSAGHHLQAGAEWADTPRALAGKSDVIFTSLPEPADVRRSPRRACRPLFARKWAPSRDYFLIRLPRSWMSRSSSSVC
jgi:hypothetical protein